MRPAHELECIEFHTRESGRVTAQMGLATDAVLEPDGRRESSPRPRDMVVLSVAVTETTAAAVHTVTHVLIALIRPRWAVERRRFVDDAKPMYDRDR
jgi:hypothetical protein